MERDFFQTNDYAKRTINERMDDAIRKAVIQC